MWFLINPSRCIEAHMHQCWIQEDLPSPLGLSKSELPIMYCVEA